MPTVQTKEIKTVDKKGLDFIAKEEGCILHPYKDSAGIWTIGIGCTYYPNGRRVRSTDAPITQAMAYSMFRTVLKTYEKAVWSVTRDDISQNNFNSLVSLCFNIGVFGFKNSTLLRRVNENPNDKKGITDGFLMWRKAGGEPILLARRKREVVLYFT